MKRHGGGRKRGKERSVNDTEGNRDDERKERKGKEERGERNEEEKE